ncbi:metal-dependent hydrolase [Sporolactobacillus sp. CPB3-1]|uniref:Metal-dependent hydrolase n=1 Tax=Sporolactobacillus mangiferae TaxID=2940498 RepID=A0ABT0MAY9_9BACL|nr:metal-dependent hydrolase [Sporolactobacillus mangiferae]MCL1632042.1 metal-dependent hydrolase [Sporolactobacillus mangiferae]
MDTATHIVMGLGVAALATLDPAVAQNPLTSQTVMIGVVAGSVIPDIDTILKLKDNATYIRNHRGVTHSLPATLLWPFLLTAILTALNPGANIGHLLIWTLAAVSGHVFVDLFNAYGTQAIRPFTGKWVAFGTINIFDPFIFMMHLIGFGIWMTLGHPGITFILVYSVITVYYILRGLYHRHVLNQVKSQLPGLKKVFLSPTWRWSHYHVAAESDRYFYVGKVNCSSLLLIDRFDRTPIDYNNKMIKAAMQDKNVRAFLSFSPIYHWSIAERGGRYVIQLTDLRYYSKGTYPFTATVWLDKDLSIESSYTGWVFSEQKLRKKLVLAQLHS